MSDDFTRITGVKVWKSGLWEVVREQVFDRRLQPPPKRTDSRRWSKKSQRRLIANIIKSEVQMTSLITLTFSTRTPINNGKVAKKILNRFLVSLRRRYPTVEYWWVQEFTGKGMPHYHVLTNITKKHIDRAWLGAYWAQATLYRAPDTWAEHRGIANDIIAVHGHKDSWQALRTEDGAARYLLSYVGKEQQKTPPPAYKNVGRWWGCSKGVVADNPPDEVWPIDEQTLRDALRSWGLDWVASWEFLPRNIHVPPGAGMPQKSKGEGVGIE